MYRNTSQIDTTGGVIVRRKVRHDPDLGKKFCLMPNSGFDLTCASQQDLVKRISACCWSDHEGGRPSRGRLTHPAVAACIVLADALGMRVMRPWLIFAADDRRDRARCARQCAP